LWPKCCVAATNGRWAFHGEVSCAAHRTRTRIGSAGTAGSASPRPIKSIASERALLSKAFWWTPLFGRALRDKSPRPASGTAKRPFRARATQRFVSPALPGGGGAPGRFNCRRPDPDARWHRMWRPYTIGDLRCRCCRRHRSQPITLYRAVSTAAADKSFLHVQIRSVRSAHDRVHQSDPTCQLR
jgi:hypothetical protein